MGEVTRFTLRVEHAWEYNDPTMRRFLLVIGLIVCLVIFGLVVFLVTFDADRYRPQVVSQLERSLGRPVKLSRLSLGWHGGIAIQLQGLAIDDNAASANEPPIQVESASAVVRLAPLLRKEVQVASVVLTRPHINVTRDAQGRINLLGLAAAASPAGASGRTAKVGQQAVSVNIDSLRIAQGIVRWSDALTRPPTEVWLRRLDVVIKPLIPGEPMDIDVKGALQGEVSNLQLSGQVTLPTSTEPGAIARLRFSLDDVSLEQILPPVPPTQPQVRGVMTMRLQGDVGTLNQTQWLRSVSGHGTLAVKDPVIVNLNLLRAVFERLSMLPGLVEALEARLPPEYREKFQASDTILAPFNASVDMEQGVVRFDELQIRTDTFGLVGTGRIGLEGGLEVRSTLRIDAPLSAALIRSVEELHALTNSAGELELPLTIHGQLPRIAVLPDLQYVASKLLATKAQDLLGSFLDRVLEQTAPAASP